MKWKQLIIPILMLALIQVVSAYDMCEWGTKEITKNCTMPTPQLIGCGTNDYTIYNFTSGASVENALLSDFITPIPYFYEFNITLQEGDYLLVLCDGTAMQFKVKSEETNFMIAAAIILLGIIAIFSYFAVSFSEKGGFVWIKLLFLGCALFFVMMMVSFGRTMLNDIGASADMISLFNTGYWAVTIITFLAVVLIMVSLLFHSLKSLSDINKKKSEDKYGKE